MESRANGTNDGRRRRARTFVLIVAAVVFIVLLILIFGPMLWPTEGLRGAVVARAEEMLERSVEVGEVRVRVLPLPVLELREVRVGAAEEAATESLANIESIRVRISPLPLLSRRVDMPRITIEGGALRVERLPDGTFPDSELLERPPPPDVEPEWDVAIGEIVLRSVEATLVDRHVVPGETVETSVRRVRGHLVRGEPGMGADVDLVMAVEQEARNLRIRGRVPAGTVLGEEGVDEEDAPAPIDVRVEATEVSLALLRPYTGNLADNLPRTVTLDLRLAGDLAATLEVEGTIDATPELVVVVSGLVSPGEEPMGLAIDLSAARVPVSEALRLASVMEALPSPLRVDGEADVRGRIGGRLDDVRLGGWLEAPDVRVVAGTFVVNSVEDGGFLFEAGGLRLLAEGRLGAASEQWTLDVEARRLVVDYEAAPDPEARPLELPETEVILRARVEEGRLFATSFVDLAVDGRFERGELALGMLLGAHEGRMRANLRSDFGVAPSAHGLEIEITGVEAGALVAEVLEDQEPLVTGMLDTTLAVAWRGIDWSGFQDTATGEGEVSLRQGRITTLDLEPDIGEALLQVAETIGVLPPQEFTEPTLRDAAGSFVIRDGFLLAEIMDVRSRFSRILVSGGVRLDRRLEVSGSFAFMPEVAEQFGPIGRILRGPDGWLAVPFSLGGTVENPDVSVDVEALVSRAAQGLVGTPDARWEELRRLWRQRRPSDVPAPSG